MANISITPVGASLVMPSSIIGPILGAKPPNSAKRIGITIRAISAERRLVMIRNMKVMTMAKPRKVSMGVLQGRRDEGKANRRGQRRTTGAWSRWAGTAGERGMQDIRITIVVFKSAGLLPVVRRC